MTEIAAPFMIVDVGPAQGKPDWKRVATSSTPKIDGVYLKATEGASGAGSSVGTFDENAARVLEAGLPLGCYHFLSPFSEARAQADHFLAAIDGCGHTLCPMVDAERSVGAAGKFPKLDALLEFLELIGTALDVVPLIYTAGWVAVPMEMRGHPELRQHPLWVPSYTRSDPHPFEPWGAWSAPDGGVLAWQFTSSARVPGISVDVDLTRFKAMPAWTSRNTEPPPTESGTCAEEPAS